MNPNTSKKSITLLSINLLCYVLTASGRPSPPSTGGGFGNFTGNEQLASCPLDALKLGVCLNLLGGLVGVVVGTPPVIPCCSLLAGLADLEAAVCLCTVIRLRLVGMNVNLPVYLSLMVNACAITPPSQFICA